MELAKVWREGGREGGGREKGNLADKQLNTVVRPYELWSHQKEVRKGHGGDGGSNDDAVRVALGDGPHHKPLHQLGKVFSITSSRPYIDRQAQ